MLDGKLVLVTGASRGIGKAIALNLGGAGATVIGTATTEVGADNISKIVPTNLGRYIPKLANEVLCVIIFNIIRPGTMKAP